MANVKRKEKQHGGWADWLADRILRMLIFSMNTLPLRLRLNTMSFIMRRVIAGPAGYRNRAQANLKHVWAERPTRERDEIAEAAIDNAARTIIENYDVTGLCRRMKGIALEGDGISAVEKAHAEGRPILFVTGHFGNFEAPRAALAEQGIIIGGLYRPMTNPYFNEHYKANMYALSGPMFTQGRKGTMGLMKHLKSGGKAVLLYDLYDSAGVPMPFLGKPAPTLTSAADIAARTGAEIIPYFGIRAEDGVGLRAIVEAPIAPGTPEERMTELNARLEARIAENPGQWFWIHRRWKPKRQAKHAAKRQRETAAPKIGP